MTISMALFSICLRLWHGDCRAPTFGGRLREDSTNTTVSPLDELHNEISECRVCEPNVRGFRKPPRLDRGEIGRVMVIGQGPGAAELRGTRAFAGQSGRTLDSWLIASGASAANPRKAIYFTSVIKCVCPRGKFFAQMAQTCSGFLHRQILHIRPELIITLGRSAFEALRVVNEDYNDALCVPRNTADFLLVNQYGFHFNLLHWPHPSGLNRWLNAAENQDRLRTSFKFVGSFMGGEE